MPIILLIRHGENDYVKKGLIAGRIPGIHLNETGRQQAQKVAAWFCGAPVKAVFSSPLERAIETATPIAQVLDLPVVIRPGLIESDLGEWQGQSVKKISRLKIWKRVQNNPARMRFPGGESFADLQHRICQELETLAGDFQAKDVVICVSHADPIKLALAYFMGLPLDLFQRLNINPASISGLALDEHSCRVLTLNYDLSFRISMP
jgi:probable phosphomutase (TIGR03848 family)